MTQENKELLLKDLCARLPYGIIVETPKGKGHVCNINITLFEIEVGVNINATSRDKFNIEDIKPYLFPLSSITNKQQKELIKFIANYIDTKNIAYDWYNKNHFDYRGLISIGLAINADTLNILNYDRK